MIGSWALPVLPVLSRNENIGHKRIARHSNILPHKRLDRLEIATQGTIVKCMHACQHEFSIHLGDPIAILNSSCRADQYYQY